MSTSNLNIFVPSTGTPVHVSSAYASDFQIANNSTNPVWVGGDSSVSVSSGLLLNPGGATTWGGGQDLWAVSDKGSSGMVTCLFNASGSYTPGPTTIGISGTVPTAPGNVPTYIASWGTAIANNQHTPAGTPLTFQSYKTATLNDVSAYSSLIYRVSMTPAPGVSNAGINISNYLHLDTWFSRQSGTGNLYDSLGYSSAEWLYTNQYSNNTTQGKNWQVYTLQVPVTNQFMNMSATYFSNVALANGFDIQVQIYGSHETVSSVQYTNQSSDLLIGAPSGDMAYVQQSAIGTYEFPIETYNSDSQFHVASTDSIQHATTTIRGDLVEYAGGAITSFLGSAILPTGPTPGASTTIATGTSCRPMGLRLTIGGASNFSAVYLTQ